MVIIVETIKIVGLGHLSENSDKNRIKKSKFLTPKP